MREFWNDLTEQFRRLRVMSLCFAVILLLLGIFLVIRPGAAIRFICFLIGLCLLAYGVFLTANYFAELRNTNVLNPLPYRIILGVILLVIGLLIIFHPEGIISFASILLAVILFAFAADSFFETSLFRSYQDGRWWVQLVSAVITTALGLILVFAPIESAEMVMRIAGVAMIYTAVSMIISNIRLAGYADKFRENEDGRQAFQEDDPDIVDGEAREVPDDESPKDSSASDPDPEILEGEVVEEDDDRN